MEHTLETWYSNIKKSNLGLNSKVKKKFDKVDAVDNVAYIQFEDPEVERICHEHGVYTVDDADRVTSIKNWFSDNSYIKTFDELKYFTGLKTIEDMAFSFCNVLKSINIPDSVTSIGDRAFEVCDSLKSITIPDGVTSIEYGAFYRCTSLQSVIIPNSVSIIKARAFRHCVALKSINIPDSVTSIEECAFIECTALQSVTIPNSVTYIGGYAFYECTSLQSVTIPNNVTYIGEHAFDRCRSLQSITIPDSVTRIGGHVFSECKALKSINISKNCPVYDQVNDQTKEVYQIIQLIEPKVNESSNLGLNGKVKKKFSDVDTVDNISIIKFEDPEVERICHEHDVYTYEDAAKVTSIEDWFKENETIKSFNEFKYFTGLKEIEVKAFILCRSLQSITIPNCVTNIGDAAFASCRSLQSINIPDSVTNIGLHAFARCRSLQSITIPDSVTSIGTYAFSICKSLQSINIPNNVTNIKNGVFYGCTALQSVAIPNSVTSIGHASFYECTSLMSINIPDSVASIGTEAFAQCKSLKKVYMSSSCKAFKSIMSSIRKNSKDTIIIDPNNQKLLKRAGLVESAVRENKETNITNSQGQDVPEIGKHAENVYLPDCPFMIGKEQVDWFEYFQREKEKHTIKDVDDFIVSAKKKTELIKESNSNLGLNNKVKKKFDKVDAIDNVAYIEFEDPEVEKICHEYGVYTYEDTSKVTSIFDKQVNISWFDVSLPIKTFNEFKYFTGLRNVEEYAFHGNEFLETISLPPNIHIIGEYAFAHCNKLQSIVIPDEVTSIGVYAFAFCTSLQSINIPDGVVNIGNNAFYDCKSLKTIYISNNHPLREYLQKMYIIKEFSVNLVDSNEVNENINLGLNKKISDKFKNDKVYADDINDAIANDLLDNETFYKEIDNFVERLKMATGNFDHDVTFGRGRVHRTYCIEREVFKDDMKHHIYLSLRSYDLRDFSEYKNSFDISICIESHAGFALHHEWNLNRKSYKKFDKFFDELSESVEFPRNEKNVYFKTTKRALEQVKKFIEMFCTHNLYIWKNSLRKEADRVKSMGMDISTKFINYTSRDVKRMMVPILDEIPSLPSEYQH